MKKIKVTLSIGVLVPTMSVIGMSGFQVAFADEKWPPDCNCVYTSGNYGIVENNDCIIQFCRPWVD